MANVNGGEWIEHQGIKDEVEDGTNDIYTFNKRIDASNVTFTFVKLSRKKQMGVAFSLVVQKI